MTRTRRKTRRRSPVRRSPRRRRRNGPLPTGSPRRLPALVRTRSPRRRRQPAPVLTGIVADVDPDDGSQDATARRFAEASKRKIRQLVTRQWIGPNRLPSLTNLPKCLELPLAQPRKGKARRGNPNGGFVEIVGVEQPHMNPLWSNIVGATNSVSRGSAGISSQKFSRGRPRGMPAARMLNVCDSRVAQTRPKLLQQIAALPHRQLPPPRAVVRSRLLRRHRLLLRATLRRRR